MSRDTVGPFPNFLCCERKELRENLNGIGFEEKIVGGGILSLCVI